MPPALVDRLPRLAEFEGHSLDPEAAIRSVLAVRFKSYLTEENVQGRVRELEADARDWLGIQAKPLADYIAERFGDVASVIVEPEVNFVVGPRTTGLE
ncbi:hypothetical protein [Saccharothrix texasensis]|uniref:hypothetical protein n=1 Tax=Saccharothrix texasensis TaxID=103734 RepID=UPI0011CD7DCA|nr:hypothetical protein [Saccharothrix texasensis]